MTLEVMVAQITTNAPEIVISCLACCALFLIAYFIREKAGEYNRKYRVFSYSEAEQVKPVVWHNAENGVDGDGIPFYKSNR